MDDLLRKGMDWLGRMQHLHCAGVVEYHRDGTIHTVRATRGRTNYEANPDTGLTVGGHTWDFLIPAEQLPGFEPAPGDIIEAEGSRYEVLPVGENFQGWRWSDPYRVMYRIHTRQVAGP